MVVEPYEISQPFVAGQEVQGLDDDIARVVEAEVQNHPWNYKFTVVDVSSTAAILMATAECRTPGFYKWLLQSKAKAKAKPRLILRPMSRSRRRR
ncbi:MAG TPA: hypothetical protein VH796_04440 [Nitrososphaeraceae archaeon]|jgi:hypothetical protein